LFTGLYYSCVRCCKCGCTTDTFEPFTILTLPIDENKETTLENSLNEFSKEESLTGDNQFHCTKCKKNVDATKKMYIWELPKILIVQFKRFKHTYKTITPTYSTNIISKISTKVSFPFTDFDLKNHVSSLRNAEMTKYDLIATSNHSGPSWSAGHYVAYCKNGTNNLWYMYDDDDVYHIPNEKIKEKAMTKDAYILFYVRQ
jgi:ubiquitin carboxyl-terminal hydrolase 8